MNFDIKDRTIFLTLHGSRAYGTHLDSSDYDIKGICIPPKEYILGFLNNFEQFESKNLSDIFGLKIDGESEGVIYDFRKFVQLATDANPNIIEVLFTSPECHYYINHIGESLLNIRDKFLSAKAKFTYCGYAHSQVHRIKQHKKYLLSPPTHKPERSEFNLPEASTIPREMMDTAINCLEKNINMDCSEFFMSVIVREKSYKNAMREWQQYQNWKATRNPDRSILEEKYKYDVKHGMHIVRIFREGEEILTKGTITVDRRKYGDADELISIRNGAWSYDKLLEYSDMMENKINNIYDSGSYVVPKEPDRKLIDKYVVDTIEESICKKI